MNPSGRRYAVMSDSQHAAAVIHLTLTGEFDRWAFLGAAAGAIAAPVPGAAQDGAIPVVDCHIHLFDQTRPHSALLGRRSE